MDLCTAEEGTIERLDIIREEKDYLNNANQQGRIVKTTGDSVQAKFPGVFNTVCYAVETLEMWSSRYTRLGFAVSRMQRSP